MLRSLFKYARAACNKCTGPQPTEGVQGYDYDVLEPIEHLILCRPHLGPGTTLSDILHGYLSTLSVSGPAVVATLGLGAQNRCRLPLPVVSLGSSTGSSSFLSLSLPPDVDVAAYDGLTVPPPFAYAGFEISECDPFQEVPAVDFSSNSDGKISLYLVCFCLRVVLILAWTDNASSVPTDPGAGSRYPSHGRLSASPFPISTPQAPTSMELRTLTFGSMAFTLTGTLGSGGFGRVVAGSLLLEDPSSSVPVAIKVLHKDKVYQDENGRDLVVREGEALRCVTRSDKGFLTRMVCSWDDEENVYFVMVSRSGVWEVGSGD